MRSRSISRKLRSVVACSLASAACTSSSSSSISEEGFAPACVGNRVPLLEGFSPAPPVDYIAFRSENRQPRYDLPAPQDAGSDAGEDAGTDAGAPAQANETITEGESRGTPCAGATDVASCRARLDALRVLDEDCNPSGNAATCFARYLVYTRGDEVGRAYTNDEVKTLFGTIDTKEEAFYLASLAGYSTACNADVESKYRQDGDAFELIVLTGGGCRPSGTTQDKVVLRVATDGTIEVVAREKYRDLGPCAEGRRPVAHEAPQGDLGAEALARYLAKAAHLEAASVIAFDELERELRAHGAPRSLLAALRRAKEDERRHARTVKRLAKKAGGRVPRVRAPKAPRAPRPLFEIALHNAIEGCVRETYASAMALFRAARAEDPGIRRAMRAIAEDEIRHASLSFRLKEWIEPLLSDEERAAIAAAERRTIAELFEEIDVEVPERLCRVAGVPSRTQARALFANLARDVWAQAA